jgi:hypothetical protein
MSRKPIRFWGSYMYLRYPRLAYCVYEFYEHTIQKTNVLLYIGGWLKIELAQDLRDDPCPQIHPLEIRPTAV